MRAIPVIDVSTSNGYIIKKNTELEVIIAHSNGTVTLLAPGKAFFEYTVPLPVFDKFFELRRD